MSRHDARIAAVRAVYCGDHINKTPTNESLLFDGLNLDAQDKSFYEQLIDNMGNHVEQINALIEDNTKNWKIDRISKVDMAILHVAVYELLFDDSVPDKSAIDEAVRIAKEYSTEKSGSYINGVLSGVYKYKYKQQ